MHESRPPIYIYIYIYSSALDEYFNIIADNLLVGSQLTIRGVGYPLHLFVFGRPKKGEITCPRLPLGCAPVYMHASVPIRPAYKIIINYFLQIAVLQFSREDVKSAPSSYRRGFLTASRRVGVAS